VPGIGPATAQAIKNAVATGPQGGTVSVNTATGEIISNEPEMGEGA
jgi:DNA uptake protein ComE-like DNA-binding protein